MSNGNKNQSNAARSTEALAPQGQTEIGRLQGEVETLRKSFVDLALLVLPHSMRKFCACGKLACLTSTATSAGSSNLSDFDLCEDCKLPSGFTEARRVSLSPSDRDTVRIANGLGVYTR